MLATASSWSRPSAGNGEEIAAARDIGLEDFGVRSNYNRADIALHDLARGYLDD